VIERRTKSAQWAPRLALAVFGAMLAADLALAQPQGHGYEGRGAGGPRGGGRAPPAGAPGWRGGPAPGPRAGPRGYDPRQHNGYWVGPRWYFGAPASPTMRAPGYRPGFAPWRPGGYLPPQYPAAVIADYWRYHLRRPPYGFHWVQAGDEFLLVSMSTGQIFDVVIGY